MREYSPYSVALESQSSRIHRQVVPDQLSAYLSGDFAALHDLQLRETYGDNPHYHQATDTPDTLDYPRMTEVTIGVASALRFLAS